MRSTEMCYLLWDSIAHRRRYTRGEDNSQYALHACDTNKMCSRRFENHLLWLRFLPARPSHFAVIHAKTYWDRWARWARSNISTHSSCLRNQSCNYCMRRVRYRGIISGTYSDRYVSIKAKTRRDVVNEFFFGPFVPLFCCVLCVRSDYSIRLFKQFSCPIWTHPSQIRFNAFSHIVGNGHISFARTILA